MTWFFIALAAVIVLGVGLSMTFGGDDSAPSGPTVAQATEPSPGAGLGVPVRQPAAPRRVLTVRAPEGAQIMIGSDTVGTGSWSTDTLAPGRYNVSASIVTRTACPFAVDPKVVTVADSGAVSVELTPRDCGWIAIHPKYGGKFDNPELTLSTLGWNRKYPIKGTTPLRLKVPIGQHQVRIQARYCYPYSDSKAVRVQNDSTNPLQVFATLDCNVR